MLQKLTLLAAASVLLVAAGCKKKPLEEFTSKEYKFKAKFPGQPTEQERSKMDVKAKFFSVESRSRLHMVAVSDLPIPPNEPADVIGQRLEACRDSIIDELSGRLKSSRVVTLNGKYPGRDFTAGIVRPKEGLFRGRMYLVGTRLYIVEVMGPDSYVTSPEATAFLDAFQLLG